MICNGIVSIISMCGVTYAGNLVEREQEENRRLWQQLGQMRDQLKDQEIQHLQDKLNQTKNPYN